MGTLEHGERGVAFGQQASMGIGAREMPDDGPLRPAIRVEQERQVGGEGQPIRSPADKEGEALARHQGMAPGGIGGVEMLGHVHGQASGGVEGERQLAR
jgi:hypothetical protein